MERFPQPSEYVSETEQETDASSDAEAIKHGPTEHESGAAVEHARDALASEENALEKRMQHAEDRNGSLARRAVSSIARHAKIYAPLLFVALTAQPHVERAYGVFVNKDKAKQELKDRGITSDQRLGYVPGVAEAIYEGVTPLAYDEVQKAKDFVPNLIYGREYNYFDDAGYSYSREDAWSLYLGMPQEHGSFDISDFQPSKGHEDKFYYKLPRFFEDFGNVLLVDALAQAEEEARARDHAIGRITAHNHNLGGPVSYLIKYVATSPSETITDLPDVGTNVMGHFTLGRGKDENGPYIYYYDKWDLGGSAVEGEKGLVGKPFEIYDRQYYDPDTFEPVDPDTR